MSLISWTPCHQAVAWTRCQALLCVCFVFCLNYNLLENKTHFLSMIYDSVKLKCETLVVILYTIQNSSKSLSTKTLYLFD